jgi:dnd system-associated protein 4
LPDFEESEAPRDVRIEEDNHSYYEELTAEKRSPFHEAEYKDLFIFAMAYGYRHGNRVPLEGETRALVNVGSLTDRQQWIVKAVAIKEVENGQILTDNSQIYDIAYQYGNGGIEELYGLFKRPGDGLRELSNEIIEQYQDLKD